MRLGLEKTEFEAQLSEEIIFEATDDANLIKQYIDLRKRIFASKPVTEKTLSLDQGIDYELETYVLVAHKGNRCLGGCLLLINYSNTQKLLPMESAEFKLFDSLPELELEKKIYSYCGHFVVDPEYRNGKIAYNLITMLRGICQSKGVEYIFFSSPLIETRRHTISCREADLKTHIYYNLHLPMRPSFNGFKRFLVRIDVPILED